VGEAQQIERPSLRPSRRPTRAASSWRTTELDQSGLFWVQAQAILAKSLRQHGQHPTRIFFHTEAQHRVVRVAHQHRPTLQSRLDVLLEPHVQHFV
jgi:hypothetical protein